MSHTADPRAGSTCDLLVQTAERMFAERGAEAVSLRAIAQAAGQWNNSAVLYHFGTRHGLISAIFSLRLQHINADRIALLDRIDAEDRRHDPRALARAFIDPLLGTLGSTYYVEFLRRVPKEELNSSYWDVDTELTTGMSRLAELIDAYLREVVGMAPAVAAMRRAFMFSGAVDWLALRSILERRGDTGLPDRANFESAVIDGATAILCFPPSSPGTTDRHDSAPADPDAPRIDLI
jgi:AcrR family transcriptional regulator